MKKVALVKTSNYQLETVSASIDKIWDSLQLSGNMVGKRVTLKPNLLMKRRPEECTTTHPVLVEAVIRKLKSLGVSAITIADSPGGPYNKAALTAIYQSTGMADVAKRTGAAMNFDFSYQEVPCFSKKFCRTFNLITPVLPENTDYIISLGKVKTHCMTSMSGGVKNLFGCIPGLQKPELHYQFKKKEDFCGMLVDLAETVSPHLTILDGVESMEGDGPSAGQKRKTDFLIACESPFLLDRLLCRMLGFSPDDVPTVRESIQRDLCPEDVREVETVNIGSVPLIIPGYRKPSSKSVDFTGNAPSFLAKPIRFLGDRFFIPRPMIQRGKCVGCGKCAESCPAKTIRIIDKKAKIQYDNCIRCFCCHEMCPVKAIDVKRSGLARL